MTNLEEAIYMTMLEITDIRPAACELSQTGRQEYYRELINNLQMLTKTEAGKQMIRIQEMMAYRNDIKRLASERNDGDNLMRCTEELSELIQAISKINRCFEEEASEEEWGQAINHMRDEIADVMISIDLLKYMFTITDKDMDVSIREKMYRCMQRLNAERYQNAGKTDD